MTDEDAWRQAQERDRLQAVPGRCGQCGEYVEIDRNSHAKRCLRCSAPNVIRAAVGAFASPGVWRIGPVVFDWDGAVSVARCEACSRLNVWRWGERVHKTAINHAKLWHDVEASPYRLLAPLRSVECDHEACTALVAVSEDFPEALCFAHREAAA